MLAWELSGGVSLLRWTGVTGVVAAFSGRVGGVSGGSFATLNLGLRSGDDLARVVENRRRLCRAVGADPARTSSCHQMHSATVHRVAGPPDVPFDDPAVMSPFGDGLVSETPGRALVVFAADCVPVAIARRDGSGIAVCHAGWRGLVEGVVEEAARTLGGPDLVAAIGPCAGADRYEVGAEVAEPLVERFGADAVRAGHADLELCAERALRRSGVGEVEVAGLCTIGDDERFFSHRRDGEPTGRQALIALIEEG